MTTIEGRRGNAESFGLARAVSTLVGAAFIIYGMRRRSWIGRLVVTAGTGLVARSVGKEGTAASILAMIRGRISGSGQKQLRSQV